MYRILLVEDDAAIAATIKTTLDGWGYQAHCVAGFDTVMQEFDAFAPHLVLMDLNLPFRGGYHWCAEMRRKSHLPIVFISSTADNMSLVTAIHQGADDFIAKPFDLNVLVAKVQVLLRRSYDFAAELDTLSYRGAVLHRATGRLQLGEQSLELTGNEQKSSSCCWRPKAGWCHGRKSCGICGRTSALWTTTP